MLKFFSNFIFNNNITSNNNLIRKSMKIILFIINNILIFNEFSLQN